LQDGDAVGGWLEQQPLGRGDWTANRGLTDGP